MSTPRNAAIAAPIAALVAAAIGLTAFTPAAIANPRDDRSSGEHRMDFGRDRDGNRFQLIDLRCGAGAADRLDQRLGSVAARLELTTDQQTLYDTFRASALTAQTAFADACGEFRPAVAGQSTDPIAALETRLKMDEARVAALNSVLPDLRAFYDSLTDEQKAGLAPQRAADSRPDGRPGFHGRNDRGPRGDFRQAPPAPNAPSAPGVAPAPEAAPAQ